MGYYLNKVVGGLFNPLVIGLGLFVLSAFFLCRGRRRRGLAALGAGLVWFWFWGTAIGYLATGLPLERAYPAVRAEEMPKADAIVLLGGGMSGCPEGKNPYAEMSAASDRVWHAARLYKAGRAPLVIPTGCGEKDAAAPLLRDFGVPDSAILVENDARNTEENARFVKRLLEAHAKAAATNAVAGIAATAGGTNAVAAGASAGGAEAAEAEAAAAEAEGPVVLLVTSAWHMRRSELNFRKFGFRVIPAAADYEATVTAAQPFDLGWLLPNADSLQHSSIVFKEHLGYWLYRLKFCFMRG